MNAPPALFVGNLPAAHLIVLEQCIEEAERNFDQGDALTEADVAADIVRRLITLYPSASPTT